MKIKIIGKGFIGGHLERALLNNGFKIVDEDPDFIFYCAGINNWDNSEEFYKVNYEMLKECIKNINVPIVYLSSIHFDRDDDYGRSKRLGESATLEYDQGTVYRLQNTFGSDAKINHHSVVATWLYNIKHDLPIIINDIDYVLRLNYIDDVVSGLIQAINSNNKDRIYTIEPVYEITLGDLADLIRDIKAGIKQETELGKKLEKTYRSY